MSEETYTIIDEKMNMCNVKNEYLEFSKFVIMMLFFSFLFYGFYKLAIYPYD